MKIDKQTLLDKSTPSRKMMNGEKSDFFNILDSIIKQVAYKLLDVGKIPSNAAEW